jgi:hypothetical protein
VSFSYNWDGIFTQIVTKQVVDGGLIFTNHWLGVPFGGEFYLCAGPTTFTGWR